jgi:hypothetical protein
MDKIILIIRIRFPILIHNLFVDKIMAIMRIRFPSPIHNLFVDQIMAIMRIRFPPMPLQNYKHLSTKTMFVPRPAPPLSGIPRMECMAFDAVGACLHRFVKHLTFNIYAPFG